MVKRLLMCLAVETSMSIIRTSEPILVELIDLVNLSSHIPDCYSHSPTISGLFLSSVTSILPWLSLQWEILIMWLPQFPMTLGKAQNGMLHFIA